MIESTAPRAVGPVTVWRYGMQRFTVGDDANRPAFGRARFREPLQGGITGSRAFRARKTSTGALKAPLPVSGMVNIWDAQGRPVQGRK